VPDGKYSQATVQAAYRSSTAVIAKIMELLSMPVASEEGQSWVNIGLFVETLKRGPDEIFSVDTVGKAGLYSIELFGLTQRANPSPRMLYNACVNADHWKKNEAGEYDYLDAFSDLPNGPRLKDVTFTKKSESDGVLSMNLKQNLHYLYHSWTDCELQIASSGVGIALDGGFARQFGDSIFFPGNTLISQLGDVKSHKN
jgi:hypothetical protein